MRVDNAFNATGREHKTLGWILRNTAIYYDKLKYNDIVDKCKEEASKGNFNIAIRADHVYENDIKELSGVKSTLIHGKDYDYWEIDWSEERG